MPGSTREYLLSGGFAVEDDGDDAVDDVWNPHGNHRGREARYRKGGCDGHKQQVAEGQHEADADIDAHAASYFARG